jgi:hypothetical protein
MDMNVFAVCCDARIKAQKPHGFVDALQTNGRDGERAVVPNRQI